VPLRELNLRSLGATSEFYTLTVASKDPPPRGKEVVQVANSRFLLIVPDKKDATNKPSWSVDRAADPVGKYANMYKTLQKTKSQRVPGEDHDASSQSTEPPSEISGKEWAVGRPSASTQKTVDTSGFVVDDSDTASFAGEVHDPDADMGTTGVAQPVGSSTRSILLSIQEQMEGMQNKICLLESNQAVVQQQIVDVSTGAQRAIAEQAVQQTAETQQMVATLQHSSDQKFQEMFALFSAKLDSFGQMNSKRTSAEAGLENTEAPATSPRTE